MTAFLAFFCFLDILH